MSVIMHEVSVGGTTIGLRIVTESGDEIDYSSARGLTMTIEDSPIFTEGQAEGAVVAMLSIDNFNDQNWIQIDSPRGQIGSGHNRAHHRLAERGAGCAAHHGGDRMSMHAPDETPPLGFAIPICLQRDMSARGMDRPARRPANQRTWSKGRVP